MADPPHTTTPTWVALADEFERLQRRMAIDLLFADIGWPDVRFRYVHALSSRVSFVRHRFEGIPAENPLKGGLGVFHMKLNWTLCTVELDGELPRRWNTPILSWRAKLGWSVPRPWRGPVIGPTLLTT
jgi:hypothetical protein